MLEKKLTKFLRKKKKYGYYEISDTLQNVREKIINMMDGYRFRNRNFKITKYAYRSNKSIENENSYFLHFEDVTIEKNYYNETVLWIRFNIKFINGLTKIRIVRKYKSDIHVDESDLNNIYTIKELKELKVERIALFEKEVEKAKEHLKEMNKTGTSEEINLARENLKSKKAYLKDYKGIKYYIERFIIKRCIKIEKK